MLKSLKDLMHLDIHASDGDMGKVQDFLFDDARWIVRYLVVDTGGWLMGRKVVVSTAAIEVVDWKKGKLLVNLTKEQIEKSPELDAERLITRENEKELAVYYQWPMYWGSVSYSGPPTAMPPEGIRKQTIMEKGDVEEGTSTSEDCLLCSVSEVLKYSILSQDGEIGHAEDFLAEAETWAMRYLVVDTGNWLPGKKILLSTHWIQAVIWEDHKLDVDLSRESIENSPDYDLSSPIDREYERKLHEHYEKRAYWE